ncbi:MAG: hypothetical protein WCO45_06315 [Pseudanabaena sp. ELA607]|jgi:hypothetical protein
MDAFAPVPPDWTQTATHAWHFCCPACSAAPSQAQAVWVNRRSPLYDESQKLRWQEFYHCDCGRAWWGWSNERPPSNLPPKADA